MALLRAQAGEGVSAAELFGLLWAELIDLLGTPAAAALVRRALKHALVHCPELSELNVRQAGLGYACALPAAWSDPARADAVDQLRRLVREELAPICGELTGPVIARRLASVPELVQAGIAGEEEQP